MGEPKPLASLTSGLLARKGAARPAMRRQPLGSGAAHDGMQGYDDLGWNDMGYDVDPIQPIEQGPRVDIKTLLTGSMPAHNAVAEQAVDTFAEGVHDDAPVPYIPDMAVEIPAEKPEIVRQQEALQARVDYTAQPAEPPVFIAEAAVAAPKKAVRRSPAARGVRAASARDKAAFTLRLDAERHLRLRLASAIYNRSAQQILIDVLDNYLTTLPEIDAMASRLPATPSQRNSAHNLNGDDQ